MVTFLFSGGNKKDDWEEIEFTAAHCGIDNEMTVTPCVLTACKYPL